MKKILLAALLLLTTLGCLAAVNESTIRDGMPHFAKKIGEGQPATVAFIGGSITEGNDCYRSGLTDLLEKRFDNTTFKWVTAGVSGTGTELGAFRVDEQVLAHDPDLVFIDFSANGGYVPALEGIIRKIKLHSPLTDICLLYAATEHDMSEYRAGVLPQVVQRQESLAEHYGIPSVNMAMPAVALEAEGKLIWKGNPEQTDGRILFSTDGLHPLKAGGDLYAQAIDRTVGKCIETQTTNVASLPEPMYGTEWDSARMYSPADVCKRHGLWKDIDLSVNPTFKRYTAWFDTALTSDHPNSTLSFAFDGDMFGLFDIGGPEMGQLEIYVDGQMIRLKNITDGSFKAYESTPLTGSHYLNRFNRHCDNRYRPQFDLIKVEPGLHQVTIKLSEKKADKARILGADHLSDITENPEKYDSTCLRLGKLLIRGTIAECKPIKGLPKMEQQLKWEKKINDYTERNEEQAALKDATLVVGSSSIDMWKSLETDFPGHNVIRRGVSGTKAIDLYNYRHQLIDPFSPKRVIIYEGDNEIGFNWDTEDMMTQMKRLFAEIRRLNPQAEIYIVSIKPSPRRIASLHKIQTVNKLLEEFVLSQPNAGYIDIHTPMLDAEGRPRPELFLSDGLHPSQQGYDIWRHEFAKVIK